MLPAYGFSTSCIQLVINLNVIHFFPTFSKWLHDRKPPACICSSKADKGAKIIELQCHSTSILSSKALQGLKEFMPTSHSIKLKCRGQLTAWEILYEQNAEIRIGAGGQGLTDGSLYCPSFYFNYIVKN